METAEPKVYTVTALTRLIKYTLEESFSEVWVEGEISNYHHHSSGHRYLSLKDDNAVIRLVMWRSLGAALKFEPENGMKVRAFGTITVYDKAGNYQLNVRKLMPLGVGELEIAFRQLYEKLSAEGLFDPDIKKPIPAYPMRIGVVTSPTGAAVRDIIRITTRRNDAVNLVIFPARVQGDGAAESIMAGIDFFDSRDDIDVIIIGRGGGSLEDLWAFNEEQLVRKVASAKKPVVSAVGHEIDTSLSDLAADLQVSTPSAAAEMIVWDKSNFESEIREYIERLTDNLEDQVESGRDGISHLLGRPVFRRPEEIIAQRFQALDNTIRLLENAGKNTFEKNKNTLSLLLSRLESLSPLAILKRGYAVIKTIPDGVPLKSARGLKTKDKIEAVLSDGTFRAIIEDIEINQEK